jgi:arylsulfatase A-like enzyme
VDSRRREIRDTKLAHDGVIDYWHGYAAEMRSMDEQIGRLLDGLSKLGLLEGTFVVLVGDHGEGLFEHGERGHGTNVYEELMRVPFIVCDPAGELAVARIRTPVTLADAFPTIMELALGRPFERPVSGRSLVASLRAGSEPDSRPVFVERPHFSRERLRPGRNPKDRHEWGVMVGVIEDGYKLIRRPARPEFLFDLERDPEELTDIAGEETDRIHELRSLLDGWIHRHPTPPPGAQAGVSEGQLEVLRALGYIGEDGS